MTSERCGCAIPDPSDAVAESMGWDMRSVDRGENPYGHPGTRDTDCLWFNAAGEPVMCVWDFREWPKLATEIGAVLARLASMEAELARLRGTKS